MFTKPLIFVVISVLVVAVVYSPSAIFGLDNRANDPSSTCTGTGLQSKNGLALVECCWTVYVPEGTGNPDIGDIQNLERYCSTCEDGGTRGKINCSDPELQYIEAPPTPLGPFALPDDGILQQPTPKSPRPFTPQGEATVQQPPQTTSPEDDQGDDGLGPFTGPLGDRVLPELEQEGESEDGGEEKEESSIEEQPSTRE